VFLASVSVSVFLPLSLFFEGKLKAAALYFFVWRSGTVERCLRIETDGFYG
jgi:hypothetical protein